MRGSTFVYTTAMLLGLLQQHFLLCQGIEDTGCLVTQLFRAMSALSVKVENIQEDFNNLRRDLQSEREERIKLQVDNVELRQLIIQLQAENALLNRSLTVSICDLNISHYKCKCRTFLSLL
ncbi:uncharacterized protein LOC134195874 [Corticium candelabrum]|uniref:uncharacterized protein LOC134195874 n=1 Tax=Corticium candelabrum TaxID=121492 RepID=UPI002E26D4A8|nr:uncharacterized protein LOC134195874 [Corticium candelabrum]